MSTNSEADAGVSPLPHDHVIFTDLDGEEGVLVDLQTKQYYRLNETASLIWQRLTHEVPIVDIVRELTEFYDVTMDHGRSSVEAAIADFSVHHLLKTSAGKIPKAKPNPYSSAPPLVS